MRLLLLASEFPPGPGGIGTHAHQISTHLARLGWDVVVLAPQHHAEAEAISSFNSSQPIQVVGLPTHGTLATRGGRATLAVAYQIKRHAPDVLMASGKRAVILTALLSRSRDCPLVAVGHGSEFGASSPLSRRLIRWSYEQADAVTCVSEYTRGRMERMGIKASAHFVIPNGADDSLYHSLSHEEGARFRKSLGLSGQRLLLTVGRVSERKGQDLVIRALPEILSTLPDVHYLMAGLPEKQAEFEALAGSLGVAGHVHFLGHRTAHELLCLQNTCELFVMTSRHTSGGDVEGFGIAVVEAALCGTPAVVTDNCGLTEAIVDGETGIGVPENDVSATARAIVTLLSDSNRRTEMGVRAQRKAMETMTWAHRATEYDRLLRRVAAREVGKSTL